MLRWALPLAVAIVLLIARSGLAEAHATFLRSDPPPDSVLASPPPRLQIWFTEPLEAGFSDIQLLDARGQRLDQRDVRVTPDDRTSMAVSLRPVPNGTYTVAWTALSSFDGHVTRGVFSLFIGVPATVRVVEVTAEAGANTPWETAARWLTFLGAALTLGTLGFRASVLGPALRAASTPQALFFRWPNRLLLAGWIALAVGSVAGLAVQMVAVAGDGITVESATKLVTATRYGLLIQARLGLLALAAIALWAGRRSGRSWPPALAAVLLLGVLFTGSLNSHGAAVDNAAIAIGSDWLHSIAIALWAGGLINLAFACRTVPKDEPGEAGQRRLGVFFLRFSNVATGAVAVVLVTGLYQTYLHVGSLEALTQTRYGSSLMVKIALFFALLVLGGVNHFIIGPRLARSDRDNGAAAARMFKRVVAGEAVIVVLALLAAGLLTSLGPARGAYEQLQAQRGLTLSGSARGLRIALTLVPGRPGVNRYEVVVKNAAGETIGDAERVDVNFNYLDSALGAALERMQPAGEGRYTASGAALALEGRWQADVLVRRPGQEDARTAFRFRVAPAGAQPDAPATSSGPGLPRLELINLAAWFFAAVTLIAAGVAARKLGVRTVEGGASTGAGLVATALMVFVAVRTEPVAAPSDIRSMVNPFAATDESIRAGASIYQANCLSCHGVTGRGDGPAGVVLNPRPADFRVHMAAGHTDGELFNWLSNGVPGTAMPPFKDGLTEEQRWHAINFIKTFAPADR